MKICALLPWPTVHVECDCQRKSIASSFAAIVIPGGKRTGTLFYGYANRACLYSKKV